MAWSKTAWADIIGASAAKTVLAAAASTSGSVDCAGTNKYIVWTTQVVYSASTAASTLKVEWLGLDSDGAVLEDTVALFEVSLEGTASASVKGTYQLNVSGLDALAIKLTNEDDTDSASVWAAGMAGYI